MEMCFRRGTAWTMLVVAVVVLNVFSIVSATVEDDEVQCRPQHVHLSLGETSNQMVVMWATNGTCDTHVSYGASPWQLDQHAEGTSKTLADSNKDGLHMIHRVLIANLQASTTYYYRPTSNNIVSGPFYFQSPSADTNQSHEFLVVGDMGQHWELQPTLTSEALSGRYTVMLHLGGFNADFTDNNGTTGDKFMRLLEPVAAHLPVMTSPGEHESDSGRFTQYRYRFSMPSSMWPILQDKLWYSFNIGLVHFVSYSTEVFFGADTKLKTLQHDWLVKDLNNANNARDARPWIVAFGHRPMYCSGRAVEEADCAKNKSVVREGLEDLFYYYGVDLVLQAHEEQYERLYPVLKGVVVATNYTNPRAPVQIVAGSPVFHPPPTPVETNTTTPADNATADAVPDSPASSESTPHSSKPTSNHRRTRSADNVTWSAFRFDNKTQPGYGRLLVINSTHAHWEFRSGPGEEDVVDSVLLVQEHHGKFQLSDLPEDVEQEIDQHLVANGGKPGVLDVDDPERDKEHMLDADAMRRIVIGASFGGVIGLVLIILLIMKLRRRGKRRVARRWDSMDYKYGKTKLYAPGNDDDDEVDDDNDFEVDIPDGSLQTTKLINGK